MSRAVFAFASLIDKQIADTVEFDLIDNPGSRAWQYAVMLNDKQRHVTIGGPGGYKSQRPPHMVHVYDQLKDTVHGLSGTEFEIDFTLPGSAEQVSQHLLNRLHRHFTDTCLIIWDQSYIDFEKQTQVDQLLQTLNDLIHQLEPYIPTDQKIKHGWIGKHELRVINHGQELGYDISPFRQYHSWEPADLILDPYILGKTLLESFMCDDDPVHWDTAGHVKTNGGCCIMLSDHRKNIYDSDDFASWLQQHKTTRQQVFADFPLGYFVPGHRERLKQLLPRLGQLSCRVHIEL